MKQKVSTAVSDIRKECQSSAEYDRSTLRPPTMPAEDEVRILRTVLLLLQAAGKATQQEIDAAKNAARIALR